MKDQRVKLGWEKTTEAKCGPDVVVRIDGPVEAVIVVRLEIGVLVQADVHVPNSDDFGEPDTPHATHLDKVARVHLGDKLGEHGRLRVGFVN